MSKETMKQTAVEFLEQICKDRGYHLMSEYIEQAKKMEKKQIIDCYDFVSSKICTQCDDFKTGDEYYNQTFKSEQ
jgi:RNase P subunit RPR2